MEGSATARAQTPTLPMQSRGRRPAPTPGRFFGLPSSRDKVYAEPLPDQEETSGLAVGLGGGKMARAVQARAERAAGAARSASPRSASPQRTAGDPVMGNRTVQAAGFPKAWRPGLRSPRKDPLIASLLQMQPTVAHVPTQTGPPGGKLARIRKVPPRSLSPRRQLLPTECLTADNVVQQIRSQFNMDKGPPQAPAETTIDEQPAQSGVEPKEEEEEEEEEEFRNPFADVSHISDIARDLYQAKRSITGPRTSSMRHAQRLFGLGNAGGSSIRSSISSIVAQRRLAQFGPTIRHNVNKAQGRDMTRMEEDTRDKLLKQTRDVGMIRAIYNKARELKAQEEQPGKKVPARPSFLGARSDNKIKEKMKQVVHATRQIRMEQKVQGVIKSITEAAASVEEQEPAPPSKTSVAPVAEKPAETTSTYRRPLAAERRRALQEGEQTKEHLVKCRDMVLNKVTGIVKEVLREMSEEFESEDSPRPSRPASARTSSREFQFATAKRAEGSSLQTRLMRNMKLKKTKRQEHEVRTSLNAARNVLNKYKQAEEGYAKLKAIETDMIGANWNDVFLAQATVHDIREILNDWDEHMAHLRECLTDVGIGKLPVCPNYHLMELKALPEIDVELCEECHMLLGEDVRSENKMEYMWWCRTCTEKTQQYMLCEQCGEVKKADAVVQELAQLMPAEVDWDLAFAQATAAIMEAKANLAAQGKPPPPQPEESTPAHSSRPSTSRRPSMQKSATGPLMRASSLLTKQLSARDEALDTHSPRNSPRASRSSLGSSGTGFNSSVDASRFSSTAPAFNVTGLGGSPAVEVTFNRHRPRGDVRNLFLCHQAVAPVVYSIPHLTVSAPSSRSASPMSSRPGSPSRSTKGYHLRHVMGYNRPFQKMFTSEETEHNVLLQYAGAVRDRRAAVFSTLMHTPLGEAEILGEDHSGDAALTQFVLNQDHLNRIAASIAQPDRGDMVLHGAPENEGQPRNQEEPHASGRKQVAEDLQKKLQHSMLQAEVFEVIKRTHELAQPRRLLQRHTGNVAKTAEISWALPEAVRGSNIYDQAVVAATAMDWHWASLTSGRSSSSGFSARQGRAGSFSAPVNWGARNFAERSRRMKPSPYTSCDSANYSADALAGGDTLQEIEDGPLVLAPLDDEQLQQVVVERLKSTSPSPDSSMRQHRSLRSAGTRSFSTPPVMSAIMRARSRPTSSCDIEDVCCKRWHVNLSALKPPPKAALPFEKEAVRVEDSERVHSRAAADRRAVSVEEAEAAARRMMPQLTAEVQGTAKTKEQLETTIRPDDANPREQTLAIGNDMDDLVQEPSMRENSRATNSRMSTHTPRAINEAQSLVQRLLEPHLLRNTTPAFDDFQQRRASVGGVVQVRMQEAASRSRTPLLAQGFMDIQVWHATAAAWSMRMAKHTQAAAEAEEKLDENVHKDKAWLDTALMSTAPPPETSPFAADKTADFEVVDGEILAMDLEHSATDIEVSCASHDGIALDLRPHPGASPADVDSLPEDYSQGYRSSSGCAYSTEVRDGVTVLCVKSQEPESNADKTEFSQDKDEVLAADLEVAATDIAAKYDTDVLTTILDAVTAGRVAGDDESRVLSLEEAPGVDTSEHSKAVMEPRCKSTLQAEVDQPRWAADSPIRLPTPCGRRPRTGDHWTEHQREYKKAQRCFAHLGYDFKAGRSPWYQKGPLSDSIIENPGAAKPVPAATRGGKRSKGRMARPLSIEQWTERYDSYSLMPPD